jgi:alanine racemase
MSRDVTATIDYAALRHNYAFLRSYCPSQSLLAMIKANAYGHGMINIARALPQMDGFGVACVEEAIWLRQSGVTNQIVLMPGFTDAEELSLCDQWGLAAVVHEFHQLDLLERVILVNPLKVWLKIDTGMHRLGFLPEHWLLAYERLIKNPQVAKPLILMTHLACADDENSSSMQEQFERFKSLVDARDGLWSIANSAAILRDTSLHGDWVRPGLMLYGVSPFSHSTGLSLGLKPVMTLKAKLIARHEYAEGSYIGYGATYRCPKAMQVGVVAIGYGDGYPWHAKTGTPVLIRGQRCSLIGRVSMDMITVDLSQCPEAAIGDMVTLWGEDLPIESVAVCAQTIPYQLFCNLTSRVKLINQG